MKQFLQRKYYLEADVADALSVELVHLEDGSLQHALSDQVVLHVAQLLDLVVQEASFVGEDDQHQLQLLVLFLKVVDGLFELLFH